MRKVILILIISIVSLYGKANLNRLLKFTKNIKTSSLTKTINKSKYTKQLPKLPPLTKAIKPEVKPILQVAVKIANRGNFETKLVNSTKYPLALIRQYSKYGKKYLDNIKIYANTVKNATIKDIFKLKKTFPNMPTIDLNKVNKDALIKTLKMTGKKGYVLSEKLANLAIKHPKSAIVAGAYAWYVTDPESFFESKEKILNHISATLKETVSDVTKVTLNSASGITNGFVETIKQNINRNSILFFIGFIIFFILWKLRSYIMRFFKIKLDSKLDNLESSNRRRKINNNDEEGLF